MKQSRKQKERGTSQRDTMQEIRLTRPKRSIISRKFILTPHSRCFAHLLAKGMYAKYRADSRNIVLVYDMEEHKFLDSLIHYEEKRVIQQLLEANETYEAIEYYIQHLVRIKKHEIETTCK